MTFQVSPLSGEYLILKLVASGRAPHSMRCCDPDRNAKPLFGLKSVTGPLITFIVTGSSAILPILHSAAWPEAGTIVKPMTAAETAAQTEAAPAGETAATQADPYREYGGSVAEPEPAETIDEGDIPF